MRVWQSVKKIMRRNVVDDLAERETFILDLRLRLLAAADVDHGAGI
jgi:hypothetical protein